MEVGVTQDLLPKVESIFMARNIQILSPMYFKTAFNLEM